jgi:hypothetical protein
VQGVGVNAKKEEVKENLSIGSRFCFFYLFSGLSSKKKEEKKNEI